MTDYGTRKEDFRFRMRVRFHECDGQEVVFNSRYGEYVDVAALEFSRVLIGAVTTTKGGIDWRLVKQEMQWKSPARFDDQVDICVRTVSVGNTSFTWSSHLYHLPSQVLLAQAETVYVLYDSKKNTKLAISDSLRETLLQGAPGILTDCSGVRLSP